MRMLRRKKSLHPPNMPPKGLGPRVFVAAFGPFRRGFCLKRRTQQSPRVCSFSVGYSKEGSLLEIEEAGRLRAGARGVRQCLCESFRGQIPGRRGEGAIPVTPNFISYIFTSDANGDLPVGRA